jgi:hypothetical protein
MHFIEYWLLKSTLKHDDLQIKLRDNGFLFIYKKARSHPIHDIKCGLLYRVPTDKSAKEIDLF